VAAKDVSPSRGVRLGRNILRLREGRKLTQEQVAETADVSWRYLQELEAGKGINPSLNVLCGLKTALDCSWDELLAGIP
jgi:transcriptional regulator with XRE-family HTH domain